MLACSFACYSFYASFPTVNLFISFPSSFEGSQIVENVYLGLESSLRSLAFSQGPCGCCNWRVISRECFFFKEGLHAQKDLNDGFGSATLRSVDWPDKMWKAPQVSVSSYNRFLLPVFSVSLWNSFYFTPTCFYLTRTHFSLITAKYPSLIGPLCLQDLPETPVAGVLLSGPSRVERATDVGVFRPVVLRERCSLMSICTTSPRRETSFIKARERQKDA